MPRCVFCGKEVEIIDRVGRLEECPHCSRDLHSCVQCNLYDRSYHNDCRENQSPYVSDKERANFCEFFKFGRDVQSQNKEIDESKKKLENLFKK